MPFRLSTAQPEEARCTRPLGGALAFSGQEEVVRRRHGHQAYMKSQSVLPSVSRTAQATGNSERASGFLTTRTHTP